MKKKIKIFKGSGYINLENINNPNNVNNINYDKTKKLNNLTLLKGGDVRLPKPKPSRVAPQKKTGVFTMPDFRQKSKDATKRSKNVKKVGKAQIQLNKSHEEYGKRAEKTAIIKENLLDSQSKLNAAQAKLESVQKEASEITFGNSKRANIIKAEEAVAVHKSWVNAHTKELTESEAKLKKRNANISKKSGNLQGARKGARLFTNRSSTGTKTHNQGQEGHVKNTDTSGKSSKGSAPSIAHNSPILKNMTQYEPGKAQKVGESSDVQRLTNERSKEMEKEIQGYMIDKKLKGHRWEAKREWRQNMQKQKQIESTKTNLKSNKKDLEHLTNKLAKAQNPKAKKKGFWAKLTRLFPSRTLNENSIKKEIAKKESKILTKEYKIKNLELTSKKTKKQDLYEALVKQEQGKIDLTKFANSDPTKRFSNNGEQKTKLTVENDGWGGTGRMVRPNNANNIKLKTSNSPLKIETTDQKSNITLKNKSTTTEKLTAPTNTKLNATKPNNTKPTNAPVKNTKKLSKAELEVNVKAKRNALNQKHEELEKAEGAKKTKEEEHDKQKTDLAAKHTETEKGLNSKKTELAQKEEGFKTTEASHKAEEDKIATELKSKETEIKAKEDAHKASVEKTEAKMKEEAAAFDAKIAALQNNNIDGKSKLIAEKAAFTAQTAQIKQHAAEQAQAIAKEKTEQMQQIQTKQTELEAKKKALETEKTQAAADKKKLEENTSKAQSEKEKESAALAATHKAELNTHEKEITGHKTSIASHKNNLAATRNALNNHSIKNATKKPGLFSSKKKSVEEQSFENRQKELNEKHTTNTSRKVAIEDKTAELAQIESKRKALQAPLSKDESDQLSALKKKMEQQESLPSNNRKMLSSNNKKALKEMEKLFAHENINSKTKEKLEIDYNKLKARESSVLSPKEEKLLKQLTKKEETPKKLSSVEQRKLDYYLGKQTSLMQNKVMLEEKQAQLSPQKKPEVSENEKKEKKEIFTNQKESAANLNKLLESQRKTEEQKSQNEKISSGMEKKHGTLEQHQEKINAAAKEIEQKETILKTELEKLKEVPINESAVEKEKRIIDIQKYSKMLKETRAPLNKLEQEFKQRQKIAERKENYEQDKEIRNMQISAAELKLQQANERANSVLPKQEYTNEKQSITTGNETHKNIPSTKEGSPNNVKPTKKILGQATEESSDTNTNIAGTEKIVSPTKPGPDSEKNTYLTIGNGNNRKSTNGQRAQVSKQNEKEGYMDLGAPPKKKGKEGEEENTYLTIGNNKKPSNEKKAQVSVKNEEEGYMDLEALPKNKGNEENTYLEIGPGPKKKEVEEESIYGDPGERFTYNAKTGEAHKVPEETGIQNKQNILETSPASTPLKKEPEPVKNQRTKRMQENTEEVLKKGYKKKNGTELTKENIDKMRQTHANYMEADQKLREFQQDPSHSGFTRQSDMFVPKYEELAKAVNDAKSKVFSPDITNATGKLIDPNSNEHKTFKYVGQNGKNLLPYELSSAHPYNTQFRELQGLSTNKTPKSNTEVKKTEETEETEEIKQSPVVKEEPVPVLQTEPVLPKEPEQNKSKKPVESVKPVIDNAQKPITPKQVNKNVSAPVEQVSSPQTVVNTTTPTSETTATQPSTTTATPVAPVVTPTTTQPSTTEPIQQIQPVANTSTQPVATPVTAPVSTEPIQPNQPVANTSTQPAAPTVSAPVPASTETLTATPVSRVQTNEEIADQKAENNKSKAEQARLIKEAEAIEARAESLTNDNVKKLISPNNKLSQAQKAAQNYTDASTKQQINNAKLNNEKRKKANANLAANLSKKKRARTNNEIKAEKNEKEKQERGRNALQGLQRNQTSTSNKKNTRTISQQKIATTLKHLGKSNAFIETKLQNIAKAEAAKPKEKNKK